MTGKLIADSGSTKCEWGIIADNIKKKIITQGISPYFVSQDQAAEILRKELLPNIKVEIEKIIYYGTGILGKNNINSIRKALKNVFPSATIEISIDLLGAVHAMCGEQKGVTCILGTGSNSCYYNGKKIVKNSPGLGYVLGDEGSGAYLGKKVLQHYLYNNFDKGLRRLFENEFNVHSTDILESVYKKEKPNRYLASFAVFLAHNRGHDTVESIIKEGLNDFFLTHLHKYRETRVYPVNFVGSVAFGFKDVIMKLCADYNMEIGKILKQPMDGLLEYHQKKNYV